MKPRSVRVLIATDDDMAAARLEASLRAAPGLCLRVAHVRNLGRAIEDEDPTVVLLAVASARLAPRLAELGHAPPIVVVTDDVRAAWTPAARRAGVRAVLAGDAGADELAAAITAAATGLIALDRDVFDTPARAGVAARVEDAPLTGRERAVLEMVAEGLSNQAIARRLGISAYTVKFHVASILAKLGAASRTEAVSLGVRRGLISL